MTTIKKFRLLDLFCGAGGAACGYQRAGFYVAGVDINFQPNYCGDAYYQADAMTFPLDGFDVIHASPPCQGYSQGTGFGNKEKPPRLIAKLREYLLAYNKPYIIENVMGAKTTLKSPIMLCGNMFEIGVIRHRLFESTLPIIQPVHKCHGPEVDRDLVSVTANGPPPRWYTRNPGKKFNVQVWKDAMGIQWMTKKELKEAIPPAYTEYIGKQLLIALEKQA